MEARSPTRDMEEDAVVEEIAAGNEEHGKPLDEFLRQK